jgi:hypothetical protein
MMRTFLANAMQCNAIGVAASGRSARADARTIWVITALAQVRVADPHATKRRCVSMANGFDPGLDLGACHGLSVGWVGRRGGRHGCLNSRAVATTHSKRRCILSFLKL